MERKKGVKDIEFVYRDIPMGTVATVSGKDSEDSFISHDSPEVIKCNRFFLDVGNRLMLGAIDHHHMPEGVECKGETYRCATRLVTINKSYILNNLTDDATKIEIVLHENPDFDCYASAYLVEHLIKYKEFPEGVNVFADYVELVDSGMIRVDASNVRELCMVAYMIGKVCVSDFATQDYKDKTRERWFKLFDHVFEWIQCNENRQIYKSDIFVETSCFEKEIEMVEKDYKIYREETNNISICSIEWVKLPKTSEKPQKLYWVEGLVYKKTSRSCLAKYWARTDSEFSSGEGFIFTLMPMPFSQKNESHKRNRVIISVDPTREYRLYPLARLLEEAENKAENEMLAKEKTFLVRDRTRIRPLYEGKSWAKNNDPWYDGENFNFTIVDSPKSGSLLSLKEITRISLSFSMPQIRPGDNTLAILIPFMTGQPVDKRNLNINKLVKYDVEYCKKRNDGFFLEYIERYLFCSDKALSTDSIQRCRMRIEKELFLTLKENKEITINENRKADRYEFEYRILSVEFVYYKYGVGFLIIETTPQDSDMNFAEYLECNKAIRNGKIESFRDAFINQGVQHMKFFRPMIYTAIRVESKDFNRGETREIVHRMSHLLDWTDICTGLDTVNSLDNQIEIDRDCFAGFSKSGGSLMILSGQDDTEMRKIVIERVVKLFEEPFYEIFQFSFHQRLTLMRFENLLSIYDGSNKKSNLGKLRRQMMNFVTQGWFSQITDNSLGQAIYMKWQKEFESERLFDEVFRQIEAVDDFKESRKTKRYEWLSIIVFPVLIVMQILSAGLIITKPLGPETGIEGWITLLISLILIVFVSFFIKRTRE